EHCGSFADGRVGMGAAGTGQHGGGGRDRTDAGTDQHAAARDWRIRHGELLLISVCLPGACVLSETESLAGGAVITTDSAHPVVGSCGRYAQCPLPLQAL